MGFDMWRFLASPSKAAAQAGTKSKGKGPRKRRSGDIDTKLPWFISAVFFVFIAWVIFGDAILIGLARMGDPLPAWFTWLIVAHGVAVIVALVFVLNGWGWARLALVVLCLLQLLFDQTILTRWYLIIDALLLVVLVIKPANRYFANCAAARAS